MSSATDGGCVSTPKEAVAVAVFPAPSRTLATSAWRPSPTGGTSGPSAAVAVTVQPSREGAAPSIVTATDSGTIPLPASAYSRRTRSTGTPEYEPGAGRTTASVGGVRSPPLPHRLS